MEDLNKKQDSPDKKPVEFDYSSAESIFTDAMQIKISDDVVVLGLGLRDIGGNRTAKVSHTVYMSVSHFLRFADAAATTRQKILDQINLKIPK
jgi:hypothetical protein